MGSLNELLEDFWDLEKEYKEGQRDGKETVLAEISVVIKLLMGEKTMLQRQMVGLRKKLIS